jgi:hypothetical protein
MLLPENPEFIINSAALVSFVVTRLCKMLPSVVARNDERAVLCWPAVGRKRMNKKFEDAVAQVRALPDERQQEAGDLLIEFLTQKAPEIYLTSEQMADIERRTSDDEPYASDEEIRAVFSRLLK